MSKLISDLQIHTHYSRAVSSQMVLPTISQWAKKKGIGLIATGDWTHPMWFREIISNLVEVSEGIYKVKGSNNEDPSFLLSCEVSSIYTQGGKGRRIHTLIFAPSIEVVAKINKEFIRRGANLMSDGRPIMGLSTKNVAEVVLSIDSRCLIIPAHAWTPWFGVFGSQSGFDSLEECFGDLAKYVYAIETGLSSDPAMNWRISELTGRQIVSFSDAHSPVKIGREATVFDLDEVSYNSIYEAIRGGSKNRISYTIEFYPEEGKYHYTGHRNCKVVYSPEDLKAHGDVCPICGRKLTVGVMTRVEELSTFAPRFDKEIVNGITFIKDPDGKRPAYTMLVPLMEIISEVYSVGVQAKKAVDVYELMISTFGSEFGVLMNTPIERIESSFGEKMGEAIEKVRSGDIFIEPGYDGVFGKVKIWGKEEKVRSIDQESLF